MNAKIAAMEALLDMLAEMGTALAGRTVSTTEVANWLAAKDVKGWDDWVRVIVDGSYEIAQEVTK